MSKRRSNRRKNQSRTDWKQRPYVSDSKSIFDSIQPIELGRCSKAKEFFDDYRCIILSCIATIIYITGIIWGFTIK